MRKQAMSKSAPVEYAPVDASPVKAFFVSMLTRDISLEEAIMDLLDNCVDGILRAEKANGSKKPYEGHWAKITFDGKSFEISDNCGGIPWNLHDYAFHMGRVESRPNEVKGTVGVYGIGMKRAIFKMGEKSVIETQNGKEAYQVRITPDWMHKEGEWLIPVNPLERRMKEDGTVVRVENLRPETAARFGGDAEAFGGDLERLISTHYAFIIDKGLSVTINKTEVKPRPTRLVFTKNAGGRGSTAIRPFVFETRMNDVDVFLAVGFTRPIPSENEVLDLDEKRKSVDAGWTILCNDRAVVYCDRSELTGWGEAGIPRYYTQFIAISGIVEFRSIDDASKLPTTTTKRGIDAASSLFLQVKNKMREGMRLFTDYTYKWKSLSEESKTHIDRGAHMSLPEIKAEARRIGLVATRSVIPGKQFKPTLPEPKRIDSGKRRISFVRDHEEVKTVSSHLFRDESRDASTVGEKCFDLILKEARK